VMSRTLFTADHHFFHRGIIELCARPFASIEDMNDALIAAWNAVVRPADTVWHLGDFAHRAPDAKRLRALFDKLNGQKNLVLGNHDDELTRALPWCSVQQMVEITVEGQRVVLLHYAMKTWPGQRRGAWQLHGHSHARLPGSSSSLDVGVDCWGFCPVAIAQIRQRLATQPAHDMEADLETGGPQP
jgi:calcineurin-like phosphoesterase family protein